MTTAAALACVVLSYRNQPGLVAAVRSVLAQGEPVEVVVVNSGGGGAALTLAREGDTLARVPVIEREERLYVGAARNLGIAATRAPVIAFLAADCVAEPGWVAGRLRAHRAGAVAVACALTNLHRDNLCSWASYTFLAAQRMPGVPAERCQLYGLSCAREVFERVGLFREDLRTGEDTELNWRLASRGLTIRWAPEVRTAHRYSRGFRELLAEHRDRGRRTAEFFIQVKGRPPRSFRWRMAWGALRNLREILHLSWIGAAPRDRPWIVAAWLLVPFVGVAHLLGILQPPPRGAGRSG